jgi:hypothetical protein
MQRNHKLHPLERLRSPGCMAVKSVWVVVGTEAAPIHAIVGAIFAQGHPAGVTVRLRGNHPGRMSVAGRGMGK